MRALGTWLLRVAGGEGGPCSPTEATLPGMGGSDQMRCSAACQTSESRRAYRLAAAAADQR